MSYDALLRRLSGLPGFRTLWHKLPLGSIPTRVRYGIWSRPAYAYGVYSAGDLAQRLGLSGISVVEFGVAGGNGLLALEAIGREVGKHFGLEIAVYGVDSGVGMPAAVDYRDLPHVWSKGFYAMDERSLRAKLTSAQLLLGDVTSQIPELLQVAAGKPIGFVAFDLDYYSSTRKAFRILEGEFSSHLPRVFCYFDDIIWPETACHNEYTGELLAIREFNNDHEQKKICPLNLLRHMRPHPERWNDQIYVFHDFAHSLYTFNITPGGDSFRQRPLR